MRRLLLTAIAAAALAAGCGAGDTLAEACAEHGGTPAGGFELVRDAHEHAGADADKVGYEARCADGGEAEIEGDNATADSRGWVVDQGPSQRQRASPAACGEGLEIASRISCPL